MIDSVGLNFSNRYMFGFNGQEKDNEVSGLGNSNTAEFWQYDTRLGRRFNPDPFSRIGESVYACFGLNPLFSIDPNGDSYGDYYNSNGVHLGSDGINDDKAYVADGVDESKTGKEKFTNARELSVSHSTLLWYAGTVYGESSGNKTESFSIASAIYNHSQSSGKSISALTSKKNNYSYAAGKYKYTKSMESRFAMAAAVNALTGGIDYSNGATMWDGRDVLVKGKSHFRYKKAGYDSRQGIFVPMDLMDDVIGVELNVMMHFMDGVENNKGAAYRNSVKNLGKVYDNQISVLTEYTTTSSLYTVAAAHGHTIFYSYTSNPGYGQGLFYTFPRNAIDSPEMKTILNRLNP